MKDYEKQEKRIKEMKASGQSKKKAETKQKEALTRKQLKNQSKLSKKDDEDTVRGLLTTSVYAPRGPRGSSGVEGLNSLAHFFILDLKRKETTYFFYFQNIKFIEGVTYPPLPNTSSYGSRDTFKNLAKFYLDVKMILII